MPLFKKKNIENKEHEELVEITNSADHVDEENEEKLIAVISAAIAMILKKPVSGFKVVSFKKRNNWKNI